MYFPYFVIISPWKSEALHLKILKSPSPRDALCLVWFKLAQWFWGRRFLNFVNVFSLFSNNLPWKREGPLIWTNLNPLYPRMLCAKFGWNWPSGSGGEDENVKSLQQRRQQRWRTKDKFWSEKLTWVFGSGELKSTDLKRKHLYFVYIL